MVSASFSSELASSGVPLLSVGAEETLALNLPWASLEALLEGTSSIDLSQMNLKSADEARQFVAAYGFSLQDPADCAELEMLYTQALHFIETRLLDSLFSYEQEPSLREMALSIPDSYKQQFDLVALILAASQQEASLQQKWACALLKVLHTLVHIEHTYQWQALRTAREQIIRGFRNVLSHNPETGAVVLAHPAYPNKCLPLHGVEIKEMKSKESLLIKLLSKKAHVAEQADDLIGLRFITEQPLDTLLAIDLLRDFKLMVLPNVNCNRSRNSLLHVEQVRQAWQAHQIQHPNESWQQVRQAFLKQQLSFLPEANFQDHNPNSSLAYRSIHITVRHLLRLPQQGGSRIERVFFPVELQFIDKENYALSQTGEVAHTSYKQRQLLRARRRVLGDLLPRHYRAETQSSLVRPLTDAYERWLHED
jgi:uncharacterized protein (TIGR04562 family)